MYLPPLVALLMVGLALFEITVSKGITVYEAILASIAPILFLVLLGTFFLAGPVEALFPVFGLVMLVGGITFLVLLGAMINAAQSDGPPHLISRFLMGVGNASLSYLVFNLMMYAD